MSVNNDKEWIVLNGNRNCGKGVLSYLIENLFKNYISLINSNNLIYQKV